VIRFLIYLLLVGMVLYFLSAWGKRQALEQGGPKPEGLPKPSRKFGSKRNPRETWVQVYETDSLDEGRVLQARLEEEELECVLYEQGKKDIHGNPLKGIGIAVPKSGAGHAQRVISRMPV